MIQQPFQTQFFHHKTRASHGDALASHGPKHAATPMIQQPFQTQFFVSASGMPFQTQFLISGMSSPCSQTYSACSFSFCCSSITNGAYWVSITLLPALSASLSRSRITRSKREASFSTVMSKGVVVEPCSMKPFTLNRLSALLRRL